MGDFWVLYKPFYLTPTQKTVGSNPAGRAPKNPLKQACFGDFLFARQILSTKEKKSDIM